MEDDALTWCLCELHDGAGHFVDWGELETLVECLVRYHADDHVCAELGEEVVGVEVDLELTVLLTCGEVADAHDLGIESVVCDGIEHQFLGLELGIDVLVGIDVLSDVEALFGKLHFWTRDIVHADTRNAVGGDVYET